MRTFTLLTDLELLSALYSRDIPLQSPEMICLSNLIARGSIPVFQLDGEIFFMSENVEAIRNVLINAELTYKYLMTLAGKAGVNKDSLAVWFSEGLLPGVFKGRAIGSELEEALLSHISKLKEDRDTRLNSQLSQIFHPMRGGHGWPPSNFEQESISVIPGDNEAEMGFPNWTIDEELGIPAINRMD